MQGWGESTGAQTSPAPPEAKDVSCLVDQLTTPIAAPSCLPIGDPDIPPANFSPAATTQRWPYESHLRHLTLRSIHLPSRDKTNAGPSWSEGSEIGSGCSVSAS